jgi:hypothetical protein
MKVIQLLIAGNVDIAVAMRSTMPNIAFSAIAICGAGAAGNRDTGRRWALRRHQRERARHFRHRLMPWSRSAARTVTIIG